MVQERRQPLPVGRYWLDLRPGTLDTFRAWVASNPKRVATDTFEAHGGVTFTIFRVLQPTKFDQRTFGFPTIATPDVQHAADTAQRPPVPTPASTFGDALTALASNILDSSTGRVFALLGLVYAFSKGKSR